MLITLLGGGVVSAGLPPAVYACVRPFDPMTRRVEFHEVTLEEALQGIRELSRKDDVYGGVGLNIVLESATLSPVQRQVRFSLVADDVRYKDLVYALCHRLGLGCRMDPFAVVFGPGGKIAKPTARKSAVELARKIQLHLTLDGRDTITGENLLVERR
ncbi:hypothetical protein [Brevifollis gellanilyticus]|uniref:Uncharacterized protein n=1 Tax=Brevifollis gellanilyticus TaxID=748831 RepID=A0A512MCQ0_9BACT|nr:hypothetical protein [Brevifollis gellanilyticus]GEP44482.1 hypothetical protein BGE01nite_37730 [Brevifollis gellanilyticus]